MGYWWQLWPPAAALVLVELAVNVVGDGLRDVTDKRLVRPLTTHPGPRSDRQIRPASPSKRQGRLPNYPNKVATGRC